MSRHLHAHAWGSIVALGFSATVAAAQMIPSGPAPQQAKAPAKAVKKAAPGVAEAERKDPAAAQRSLEAGVKSYEAGKLEQAIQSFSHAISGGGLPPQQMARALYYRGLAYRKQAKPAQAISDLTSAIWLKGGLVENERANAIENRALAYREAGLGEPPPLGDQTRGQTVAAASAKAASAQPAPSGVPVAAPAAATVVSTQASPSSGGVGSFFGNLFGGGSSSATAKAMPDPATTASTGPSSATSSWSDATTVAAGKIRAAGAAAQPTAVAVTPSARTAPAAPAPPAAASPGATPVSAKAAEAAKPQLKGKFRLQVAAVRSRAEAETLAKKLKDAHGSAIAGREPAIEESVIGAMGTFYRVRVGPYADANEPRQLCSKIKPDGFDCLVVTQ